MSKHQGNQVTSPKANNYTLYVFSLFQFASLYLVFQFQLLVLVIFPDIWLCISCNPSPYLCSSWTVSCLLWPFLPVLWEDPHTDGLFARISTYFFPRRVSYLWHFFEWEKTHDVLSKKSIFSNGMPWIIQILLIFVCTHGGVWRLELYISVY